MTVGVIVSVAVIETTSVVVTVLSGSVIVLVVVDGIGVAMSKQLHASEIPTVPEARSRRRKHRGV